MFTTCRRALGVGLLQQQHPPHVGVLDDRHALGARVLELLDVGALDPLLRVGERVLRGRRSHRLWGGARCYGRDALYS